jgi:transcriptional regulator with XRE-family HTH domain
MSKISSRLQAIGKEIRTRRVAARLTQDQLGKRSGIVGKYVSEIERGTRDLPLSTLCSLVEQGLGLRLDLGFAPRNGGKSDGKHTAQVDDLTRAIAGLSPEARARAVPILCAIVELLAER